MLHFDGLAPCLRLRESKSICRTLWVCIVVKVVKKATISNVQLVLEHYLHVACFTTHESNLQLQEVVKITTFQLVLQQCCKTSCALIFPAHLSISFNTCFYKLKHFPFFGHIRAIYTRENRTRPKIRHKLSHINSTLRQDASYRRTGVKGCS